MSGDTEATFILSLDDDDDDDDDISTASHRTSNKPDTTTDHSTQDTIVEFSISINDDNAELKVDGDSMSLEEQLAWCVFVAQLQTYWELKLRILSPRCILFGSKLNKLKVLVVIVIVILKLFLP
ncbi:unnamed protein product [Schistosoma turkestanicum]|nr:unnamed protein product [Schistosoma turkestanicum]